jgi:hypothetical protein
LAEPAVDGAGATADLPAPPALADAEGLQPADGVGILNALEDREPLAFLLGRSTIKETWPARACSRLADARGGNGPATREVLPVEPLPATLKATGDS